MSHPFFEATRYPIHRPEAVALLEALADSIQIPNQITLQYERCGDNLPPLTPGQPRNLMWREALQHLTAAGALKKFVDQIKQQFLTSQTMQQVIQDVENAQPSAAPVRQTNSDVDKRDLREAMVKAFSASELADICLDVQESLSDAGIDLEVNLDVVGGDGKRSQVLNLIQYLDRRRYLSYLVDAVRKVRPGII